MKQLLEYLNGLPVADQASFACRCGTTVGYLRKAVSVKQRLKAEVCINIERESCGVVRCEMLRPDVSWYVVRSGGAAGLTELADTHVPGHARAQVGEVA